MLQPLCMGSSPSPSPTSSIFFLLLFVCSLPFSSPAPLSSSPIRPNFTASYFHFIDHSGAFLLSPNSIFRAAIHSPIPQLARYYLSVIHSGSDTIVWTANAGNPISQSTELHLTINGLFISAGEDRVWTTPRLDSPIASMHLLDSGNLVLYDSDNVSLWQSFDYPTDTIVPGQVLRVGMSMRGFVSEGNLSFGGYEFLVGTEGAILRWNRINYWKLSMETRAFKDSNGPVSFLTMNNTGMYLYGPDNETVVIEVVFRTNDDLIRVAKLGPDGRFSVIRLDNGTEKVDEFVMPSDNCRVPSVCGEVGLCSSRSCSCPPGFHSQSGRGCVPIDRLRSLPEPCQNDTISGSAAISFLKLDSGMDYFALDFVEPDIRRSNSSYCKDLCSRNCSCLGVFVEGLSGSCYLIKNYIGSIISGTRHKERTGYIKTLVSTSVEEGSRGDGKQGFPLAAAIIMPLFVFMLAVLVLGILWWKRNQRRRVALSKFGSRNSTSSDTALISIPGLPVRYDYQELAAATDNFKTKIGSGGFGIVYKGTLPDGFVVAVKKMANLGVQGNKEFLTEIAIIGNIHHVNLVKLKGYCAQGMQRFLVYEFMDRGSLDQLLFGEGPYLEWRERFEIALGTARGLAYLHFGCDHRIIHCDVKPENILLSDSLQAKISDFGLSKLLSPEESRLLTTLRGTRGYLAPEWLTSSGISDRTDVYSYGMLLLEIVRGRRNSWVQARSHGTEGSNCSEEQQGWTPSGEPRRVYFPLLALEMHEQRRYLELADPRLQGTVRSEDVERLVKIALCCVQEEPMLRPSMSNVVGMLEGTVSLPQPRVESLNFLRFYGRRFTEASAVEGSNEQNVFGARRNGPSSSSSYSMSYISSQEVSGPR